MSSFKINKLTPNIGAEIIGKNIFDNLTTTVCDKIYEALINVGFPGFIGGIFLAFANIFHIQALANTSIANALFTLSAIPFITAGLAYLFLNEKINLRTIFIMLLAILGIVIMINKGFEEGSIYGNLMALSTALCFSIFTIILRKFRKIDMLPTLVISGFIILIITILLSRGKIYISSEDIFYCFIWGFFLSGIVASDLGNNILNFYYPIYKFISAFLLRYVVVVLHFVELTTILFINVCKLSNA